MIVPLTFVALMSFFAWKKFLPSARVISFEYHEPLSKDLSSSDFDTLFKFYEGCFEETKVQNLQRYLMKYKGLDAEHAKAFVHKTLSKTTLEDKKKSFGEMKNAFVMRDRGELIGLFECREETELTRGSIMVFNVCVREDRRGQGYGNELMYHSFKHCIKPGRDLTLTVYKDHEKVVNFYKDLGFKIISNLDEWDHLFPYFNKYLMRYEPDMPKEETTSDGRSD